MAGTIASKNLYDLLGNDIEDENDVPKPPTKEVVKPIITSKKRDEPPASVQSTNADSGRGGYGRRGRGEGNDAAFRDRGAGRNNNRSKPTEEGGESRGDRPYRGRGGGGGRGGRGRDNDRHSSTARTDTDKQVSQGWGSTKGDSEWNDEQAGEQIAQAEAKDDAWAPLPTDGEAATTTETGEAAVAAPEPEPEDTTKSYAEYLAERAKQNPVAELPEARAPNEGSREDKKWAAAKELKKNEEDEYFASTKNKNKTAKQRKEKTMLEIDPRFVEPKSSGRGGGDRGGRGRGGRGGDRGDRGDFRGRGRGGDFRGDRRGGPRGGANGAAVNVSDESAFPSLGK